MTNILDKLRAVKKNVPVMPVKKSFLQRAAEAREQHAEQKRINKENYRNRPILPRTEMICPVCVKPMWVAVGQLQFCHSECKPKYKRALKRKNESK